MKKEEILIKFGIRIKELRLKNSWSQDELALRTGFHRTYIGMIERAERNLSLKNIEKLANTFNIDIKELF
jgi:transcriptional regulator with XRE-family HTH domain